MITKGLFRGASFSKAMILAFFFCLPFETLFVSKHGQAWAENPPAELLTDDDCTKFCESVNNKTVKTPQSATAEQGTSLTSLEAECLAVTGTKDASWGDWVMVAADTTAAAICGYACYNPAANEACATAGAVQMVTGITVQLVQGNNPLGAFLGGQLAK